MLKFIQSIEYALEFSFHIKRKQRSEGHDVFYYLCNRSAHRLHCWGSEKMDTSCYIYRKHDFFFEKKWNHGSGSRRRINGLLTVFLTISITTGSVFLIVFLAIKIHLLLWLVVEIFLICLALAQKSLKEAAMLVYDSLKANDLPEARKYLSRIVGRETNHLDEPEIVRGVVETVSENTSDGVTAPLMYALCFGATGAWCYKAINTPDSMIGYKNERYADFGFAAAKLDDVANYLPKENFRVVPYYIYKM